MDRPEAADVVVIGAGLSGLTTARELTRAGLEVLILEARDRPGGRTHTTQIDGVTVDLGGEWVDAAHSELRNLAGDLALDLIPFKRKKENARWYVGRDFSNAMPLSDSDANVHERMNEVLKETAASADIEAPWLTAPSEDPSVEEWLRREGMSEAGIHVVGTLVSSCGSTVPLARMSFYSYAVKVATRGGPGKGNEFRVAGGAGRVAQTLAAGLDDRVRYSSPVTEIIQDGDATEVRWVNENGPGVVRSRRVVLAIPFTLYRFIRFDPALPSAVRRMVAETVYGVVRKTHFVFDETVDPTSFTVTDTPLGYCAAVQGDNPRALVSFSGGESLLPELGFAVEKRKRRSVRLLRELYDVPEPVAVVETVWNDEHYTRGSYAIMPPGSMAGFGGAMGSSFGGVHLAGAEGYAVAPSFMNSAVKSGLRAGREVAEALQSGGARLAVPGR